jgi:hydroxymethylbilane synthase
VHDVLIARGPKTIAELPEGAVVGTCSPRRKAQLLRVRCDLQIVNLRGNVQTRLRKVLEDKAMDATLLAAAGLGRLGLGEHAANAIPVEQVLPACGQGALAVQCRVDDHITVRRCMPLNDAATSIAVNAERSVAAALGADCHSPVAILAELVDANTLRIRARVLSTDGTQCAEVDLSGPSKKLRPLVEEAVASLIAQGAKALLEQAAREGDVDNSAFNV